MESAGVIVEQSSLGEFVSVIFHTPILIGVFAVTAISVVVGMVVQEKKPNALRVLAITTLLFGIGSLYLVTAAVTLIINNYQYKDRVIDNLEEEHGVTLYDHQESTSKPSFQLRDEFFRVSVYNQGTLIDDAYVDISTLEEGVDWSYSDAGYTLFVKEDAATDEYVEFSELEATD